MFSKPQPNYSRSLRLYALFAGGMAIIVGISVLVGWILDIGVLKSVLPGRVTTKPNAAICFVLSGIALELVTVATGREGVRSSARKRVALVCSCVVAIMGIATLGEYLFGLNLHIDTLFFRNALLAGALDPLAGRMAGTTALGFALLGVALILRYPRHKIGRIVSEALSLLTLLAGMVALIGYVYGVESLYKFYAYRSMSLQTALLFFLLGLGALSARAEPGLLAVITSEYIGGLMARRLLPLAVAVPLIIGWFRLEGEQLGLYGNRFGLAIFATSNIVIFSVLIWSSARPLNRLDAKSRSASEHWRTSESRFRQLADSMPQIVWTATPDGSFDYYNQQWLDYTGATVEETKGWAWATVLHHDDLQDTIDSWRESIRTGASFEIRYRFKRASDGSYRWHLGRASAARDDQGRIVKWFGTCTDIDDQKRAEEELLLARRQLEGRVEDGTDELIQANFGLQEQVLERKRTEEALWNLTALMESILDSASYTIISTDVDGVIRTFNKTAEEQLGDIAVDVIGKKSTAILHDSAEMAKRAGTLSKELGFKVEPDFEVFIAKVRTGSVDENEWSYIRKDGSRFPVLLSVTALRNANNEITGYLGVGSDISERKQAKEKLQRQLEFTRTITSSLAEGVYAVDQDACVTFMNPAAEQLLGWQEADLLGQNGHQAIHFHHVETSLATAADCPLLGVLRNGDTVAVEEDIFTRADGTKFPTAYTAAPIIINGKALGAVLAFRDISERKQADHALAISEKRYRELVDNGQGLICTHDLNGKLLSINPAAAASLGYEPADMVGRNLSEYISPSIRSQFPHYLKRIGIETGLRDARLRSARRGRRNTGIAHLALAGKRY
jgi:PAS domain S-box-containing protein